MHNANNSGAAPRSVTSQKPKLAAQASAAAAVYAKPEPARGLLIAGERNATAQLAIRRIGKAKHRQQGLLMMDYQGKLARNLSAQNKKGLESTAMLWLDLCNRRKSVAIWRLQATATMPLALTSFLRRCAKRLNVSLSSGLLHEVGALAMRLVGSGTMGLVALAQSLRRPELTSALRNSSAIKAELDAVCDMLHWLLRFPLVWAASEGSNVPDVEQALAKGATVWLEMNAQYAEQIEHEILGWMAQARVVQMHGAGKANDFKDSSPALLVHAFASARLLDALELPPTALQSSKTVMIEELGYEGVLPAAGQSWLTGHAVENKPDCWIVGGLPSALVSEKNTWLSDAHCLRLKELASKEVWVRSGRDGSALVMLAQQMQELHTPSQLRRIAAWRQLKQSSVKQWDYAPPELALHAPPNADIYQRLSSPEALLMGWFRVKEKRKNSHGIDKVTIAQFGRNVDDELLQLAQELAEGLYRPRPLRVMRLQKADGDERLIKVACVRDRVVQAAFLYVTEPLFDAYFSPRSFAYRAGRGPQQALAMVRSAIRAGKRWVVVADIKKCFDSIDHDVLLRLFADRVADRDVLRLLRLWLQADVFDLADLRPSDIGVAQGESISPFLANIYLDPMDKVFASAGVDFARYADDYVVLCDNEAQARAALALMGGFLQDSLHLALKPAKTQICEISQGFSFLGFHLTQDSVAIPAERMLRVVEAAKNWIQRSADQHSLQMLRCDAMMRLNALIRGFRNYYGVDAAPHIDAQFVQLDAALSRLGQEHIQADDATQLLWSSRESFIKPSGEFDQLSGLPAYAQIDSAANPSELIGNSPLATPLDESNKALMQASTAWQQSDNSSSDAFVFFQRSLHVMQSGCYITRRDENLVLRKTKKDVFICPLADLDVVMTEGMGIALSCDLGMHLAEHDIALVLSPLVGLPSAALQSVASSKASLRREQVLRADQPDVVRASLLMLAAKTANQASVLHYFAKYRKKTDFELHEQLSAAAAQIRQCSRDLVALDSSDAQLRSRAMGLEGKAASCYWGAIKQLVPTYLNFSGRHTHKASDPLNSALNYVYSLLYAQVWRAVTLAGLDPYFGIIHRSQRDQGSLVFDLIEEFRAPFVDKVLLSLLGRGLLIDLDRDGYLKKPLRKKLIEAFHKAWQRNFEHQGKRYTGYSLLAQQVRSLRHVFLATGEYSAFRFRW